MKSNWPLIAFGSALGFIALIWIGSRWFGSNQDELFAARIDYLEGQIQIKRNDRTLEFLGPLNNPLPLYIADRVEMHPNAKMQITFKQGHQLEVSSGAVLVIARWNQQDSLSPILLQVTGGSLKRLHLGEDRLFILRNGELHSLESLNERAIPELRIAAGSSQPQEISPNVGGKKVLPADGTTVKNKSDAEKNDSNAKVDEGNTLSNTVIQQKLESQVSLLLQCQKLIPTKPSGRIVVSFLIDNSGKSKNLVATENTFASKPIEQCVLSVIERIGFSPFEGTPIHVTFPIAFE